MDVIGQGSTVVGSKVEGVGSAIKSAVDSIKPDLTDLKSAEERKAAGAQLFSDLANNLSEELSHF